MHSVGNVPTPNEGHGECGMHKSRVLGRELAADFARDDRATSERCTSSATKLLGSQPTRRFMTERTDLRTF